MLFLGHCANHKVILKVSLGLVQVYPLRMAPYSMGEYKQKHIFQEIVLFQKRLAATDEQGHFSPLLK